MSTSFLRTRSVSRVGFAGQGISLGAGAIARRQCSTARRRLPHGLTLHSERAREGPRPCESTVVLPGSVGAAA